jgi:hypothetical protein
MKHHSLDTVRRNGALEGMEGKDGGGKRDADNGFENSTD